MNPSDQDLQAEAAEWLVRLDAGTADEAAFTAWREGDPRRAAAFAQALAGWEMMERAASLEPASGVGERGFDRRRLLRAAGVAGPVLALGIGGVFLTGRDRAWAATEVGDRRRFDARPGVTVELNTDSRIEWSRRGDVCELWLEKGEAFLLIDDAQARGAVLHCGGRALIMTPGYYNARMSPAGTDIAVLEGAARTRNGGGIARAGQTLTLDRSNATIQPTSPGASEMIAGWRKGEVVFSGQTLGEAVAEYNRYLDRKLAIDDPALAGVRIGGRFETLRPEPFLGALESGFDIVAVPRDEKMVLRKKAPAG